MEILTKEWKNAKDIALLILRLALGFFLIHGHGWGKLQVIFSGAEIEFMDPIGIGATLSFYLAAFAEGIAAFLLIIGLFTRLAAVVLMLNFLAIFYTHVILFNDAYLNLELQNLFFFGFLVVFIMGPGKHAIDYAVFKKNRGVKK